MSKVTQLSVITTSALVASFLLGLPDAAHNRAMAAAPAVNDILKTYADIAEAGYQDSVTAAKALKSSVDMLVNEPSETNLMAARAAWRKARIPYMQTEVFRFGNKIVDDWEGKVNAWPLDEGLIDYVDTTSYGADPEANAYYAVNVIANTSLKAGGKTIEASTINKALLSDTLHEVGGVEANVATGYHAVEFLLWGQDLNGTGPGAGAREASDFDTKNCTNGNCDRRAQYLTVVTDLLIDDLDWMAAQWSKDGAARKAVTSDEKAGLTTILTGMGSLSYGEMAGERIKLGLMLHDPEEEHDCFSDNTHNSHYFNVVGIRNVYTGSYTRPDGSKVFGPSISDLVKEKSADIDSGLRKAIDETISRLQMMVDRAENKERYDQMLALGNSEGNAVIQAVSDGLVAQTKQIEKAVAALGLSAIQFEGSDSLDAPEKVGAP